MNEKLKECVNKNNAKKLQCFTDTRHLMECFSKDACDNKISFGKTFFCRLSPLYEDIPKV